MTPTRWHHPHVAQGPVGTTGTFARTRAVPAASGARRRSTPARPARHAAQSAPP